MSLLKSMRSHISTLENLEYINIDPNISQIISNEKGKELYIENEFYKARGFRKLHIEIAEFSTNLKILHCVFFPDPKFDIPIFGVDLVKINNVVSAAIVDLSPASKNQEKKYEPLLSNVDKSGFISLREIPRWGDIFSKNVFFASLKNHSEMQSFCRIVEQYLRILIQITNGSQPDTEEEIINERILFQKNYCVQQMKNEKTSMILLKYFDEKWVDNYLKNVLFDF